MKYHKLVRDRIPQIIESQGKTCVTEVLSQEVYLQMLDEKLNEELAEYQESKSLEELADLLEVMDFWDDTAARKQAGLAPDDKSMEAAELISAEKVKARDRFFSLFSKWFFDLWY